MAFVIQQKSGYEPLPEGQHAVTITEVKDLGEQDTPFGKKHQLYLNFTNTAGKSMRKYYTASINEKATLYKDIKAITGKAPVKEFDVDTLVGRNLQIVVTHEEGKDGKVRGKIAAFLKAAAGQSMAKAQPRPAGPVAAGPFAGNDGTGITDADVAF